MAKKKRIDKEIKLEAMDRCLNGDESPTKVAKELGIKFKTLTSWVSMERTGRTNYLSSYEPEIEDEHEEDEVLISPNEIEDYPQDDNEKEKFIKQLLQENEILDTVVYRLQRKIAVLSAYKAYYESVRGETIHITENTDDECESDDE